MTQGPPASDADRPAALLAKQATRALHAGQIDHARALLGQGLRQ